MDFSTLPKMPFYTGLGRVDVAQKDAANFHGLVHRLRWLTPKWALKLGDAIGKRMIVRTSSPYLDEIDSFGDVLGTGVYTLNTGYEWACTALVRECEDGQPHLNRVLDWALPMGPYMHVAHYDSPCGSYYDINWAGNSGIINAVAPKRFAISINQAPLPQHCGIGMAGFPVDWVIQRFKTFRSKGWLPSHLLRHVFETCRTYDDAVRILSETELAIPVIYTVCGAQRGERVVIERRENEAHCVRDSGVCTANHWQQPVWKGHARPIRSRDRLGFAQEIFKLNFKADKSWDWLQPPVFNSHSIMAFVANTDGLLKVVHFKKSDGKIIPIGYFSL